MGPGKETNHIPWQTGESWVCTCLIILSLMWPKDRRLQPKSSSVASEGLSYGVLRLDMGKYQRFVPNEKRKCF